MRRLIALAIPAGPAFVEALQRAWDEGDAVLPLDLRLSALASARLLATMRPACVIDALGRIELLAGEEAVEDGDALVMATSGTTGEPKGVVLTHTAVAASALATNQRLGVDPSSDAWWACLPLGHVGGLSVVTRALAAGVTCEVGAFSVAGAAAALRRGTTLTSLVPTALARLDAGVVAGFRRIVLGGQAPPVELPPNVTTTYGLTETGSGVVYDGVALDGVEVRIVDGEIQLRGPMLLRAYRSGEDPKSADGWLSTGDAGAFDFVGRLAVLGRGSEMIITGGENVWPTAVEAVLLQHPRVAEAAVGGVVDQDWGERVVAYVVVKAEGAVAPARLLDELRDLVKAEIAPFAAPREVVVVASLPRTALGKVIRSQLGTLGGTENTGGPACKGEPAVNHGKLFPAPPRP